MLTNQTGKLPRIAYLLSQYPAISHTFFLNEVLAMRELGFEIETASVNAIHPPTGGFPELELGEATRTFYIKQCPKGVILGVILKTLLTRPAVVVRGLAAALRLRPWDLPGMAYSLFYLVEAILLGDWMLRKGCAHLHVHFGGAVATVGMLASIAWGVPYSLTIHGPEEFYDVGPSFLEQKIRVAKFVTCISHFCRSQLLKISPVEDWHKFHVCRLGVRTDVFKPRSQSSDSSGGDQPGGNPLHLVSVGRLHPAKGQMVLLRCMHSLLGQGLAIKLSIVGDGSGGRDDLRRYLDEHGMNSSVTLLGSLSHPATRAVLQTADLFVLPSFAEGVPVALMEAMAMRIACISTFVAGIPELIEPGKHGLLVPPSSEEDLAQAILTLVTNRELRSTIGHAGQIKVLNDYNLSVNIRHFAEVFGQYSAGRIRSHERLDISRLTC